MPRLVGFATKLPCMYHLLFHELAAYQPDSIATLNDRVKQSLFASYVNRLSDRTQ